LRVSFGTRPFEAQGIFFDKDGTLVDLHHQYSTLMDKRLEKIEACHPQDGGLRRALSRAVGYDADSRTIAPDGPLAVATREQTILIVAVFLSRQGLPLERAERIVRDAFLLTDEETKLEELIRPMKGLYSLLKALEGKDLSIACLTNDEHRRARAVLESLKIAESFRLILGGDEVSRPKPDPEMIETACKRLGLLPEHTVYIGDTVNDMLMAKKAGAGLAVGILGGACNRAQLSAKADVVIESLQAITVESESPGL
jgi:phosphoglycolate phosphatase